MLPHEAEKRLSLVDGLVGDALVRRIRTVTVYVIIWHVVDEPVFGVLIFVCTGLDWSADYGTEGYVDILRGEFKDDLFHRQVVPACVVETY